MNPLSGNATHVEAVAGNEYCTVELCGRLAQLVRAPPLHGGCRGFESLIAHLSFPRKISRSDSSDIPNYLACMSASRTRSRSHGFRQCFVKTSVNATDSFFDDVAFGVDARRGNRSITKKQQYGTAESNAIYTVITFAQIWNFMETSSSTVSTSKKAWNGVIPSLYMSVRPWPSVPRRAKRIRSAAFTECAQTDAVPVAADGQWRGCIHAGGLRGGLHGA